MKPTDSRHHPSEHGHSPDELHNPDVAHEHSDVNVRAILLFAAAIALVVVVAAVLMAALFWVFDRQAARRDPELSPLARPATQMPVSTTETPFFGPESGPQLLTNEPAALRQFREWETRQLEREGARVPIGEAKKLLLERGLPARAEGEVDPQLGTYAPVRGEASSGRTVTMPPAEAIQPPAPPDPPKGGHQEPPAQQERGRT